MSQFKQEQSYQGTGHVQTDRCPGMVRAQEFDVKPRRRSRMNGSRKNGWEVKVGNDPELDWISGSISNSISTK
jgi:hypothetical protein